MTVIEWLEKQMWKGEERKLGGLKKFEVAVYGKRRNILPKLTKEYNELIRANHKPEDIGLFIHNSGMLEVVIKNKLEDSR